MSDAAEPVTNRHAPLTGPQRFFRAFVANRLALASGAYLVLLLLVATLGTTLAVHDPLDVDLAHAFEGPTAEHWLGTDHLGRSTASRIISATGVALNAAALGVGIALGLGAPLGLLSGYYGGWIDRLTMRVVEAIIALPALLVAIAILAILGPSLTNAMIALGLANSTAFFRLMRGAALEVREALYVDAARVSGASSLRVVFHHVLPNVTSPLTVQTTLAFSYVLLAEAGLSFIGLGVQPPDSSWGLMLSTAQRYIYQHPFMAIPPGMMIVWTVLAFNLLGDGLRDAWSRIDVAPARPVSPTGLAQITTSKPDASRTGHLLDVRNLDVRFPAPRGGELSVINNVSFSVNRGETVGLVGESGCGKSVSAMAVMRLLGGGGRISAGSVHFEGTDLATLDENKMNDIRGRRIGMIFQEPGTSLNPAFTVANQISETLIRHEKLSRRAARERAVELLEHVGIAGARQRLDDYPHQFSGGMAQRVMIAMALACNPSLLIADEPTTALDVTIQGQVLDLLSRLQEEHDMAILLITHDLGVVADMCSSAVVMYAGQVIERGSVDDVLLDPEHPYTAGLLASMPRQTAREGKLQQVAGRVPPAWDWPAGCRFHPRCPAATGACRDPAFGDVSVSVSTQRSACIRANELDVKTLWQSS